MPVPAPQPNGTYARHTEEERVRRDSTCCRSDGTVVVTGNTIIMGAPTSAGLDGHAGTLLACVDSHADHIVGDEMPFNALRGLSIMPCGLRGTRIRLIAMPIPCNLIVGDDAGVADRMPRASLSGSP